MKTRFVSQKVHAFLDYPVALSLVSIPFLLGLGTENPLALWLSVGTGIAAFFLTVLTDHELGIFRVLPYSFHVLVDRIVGVTFLLAPFVLQFNLLESGYYWANAAAVLAVTVLLNEQSTQSV